MARAGSRWLGGRSGAPWGDPQPIRAEIFSAERFEDHARSLADSHTIAKHAERVVPLLTRLRADMAALTKSYEAIADDVQQGREITPAAEWLLDNFHAVETHVRQIRLDLSPDYFEELPKLGPGFLSGHPRIFALMWGFVAHTDSLIEPDLLSRYVRAYETRKALTLGELWAVAITLRLLLVENLRRVADLVVTAGRDRAAADTAADRLLGLDSANGLTPDLLPQQRLASRAFTARLLQRLRGLENTEVREWLQSRVDTGQGEALMVAEAHSQSAAVVTVRNIFTSLRLITDMNWEDWLESVSLIEEELRTHEGYLALDFPTRNLNRSAIEDLARRSGQEEIDVARAALQRARFAPPGPGRDVGFWLFDRGRAEFQKAIGYRPTLRRRLVDLVCRLGLPGYLTAVGATTAVLLAFAALVTTFVLPGRTWPSWPLTALLAAVTALAVSDFAVTVVNYWTSRLVSARPLPSLALRDGVPEELRTLVVIPAMLSSAAEVDELAGQLEVHHLANPDGELCYGLVVDWLDAPEPMVEGDQELLDRARRRIGALNAEHGDRFLLFHRSRRFNPAEGVWMGWERKRGKLDELNALLRGRDSGLTVAEGRLPGPFRYVITLDSDTRLPREAARRLIGKLAHPLNQAHLHPSGRFVSRGYGILQPRITPALPMAEDSSLLQRIYSTRRGADRYAFAVSDAYQDLFGQGSFTGKGIYDIDIVDRLVTHRIPENRVLSHDLLEGSYARSGLVTDIEVVEEHPTAYAVMASRIHRWTRGDWQLLGWIFGRRGVDALGRWKMADNLRRSLVPIAQVAMLVLALLLFPAAVAAVWLALLMALHISPHVVLTLPRFLLRRKGVTARSQLSGALGEAGEGVLLGGMNLVLLGHQAWLSIDAIARTLTRLLVTHRHLLEWTTAAAAARRSREGGAAYARQMAGGLVPAAAVLGTGLWRGPAAAAVAAVPALAWILAPAVAAAASRPHRELQLEASPVERAQLRRIARRTWLFFDTFVGQADNHLPPDNFQEDPEPVVAHRTSPTNIGLYLLCIVSARDLGWIGTADATERLERTLGTLERLDRHRGHIVNWLETTTLRALEPRYISTVDSGNLAACLLTLSSATRAWSDTLLRAAPEPDPAGLTDALDVLSTTLTAIEDPAREAIATAAKHVYAALATPPPAGQTQPAWAPVEAACAALVAACERLPDEPVYAETRLWAGQVAASAHSLGADTALDPSSREKLAGRLRAVAAASRQLFDEMDFGFLRDDRRGLLSVGFHIPTGRLDESCYDLLASEARLASYVAVIKRDVRTRHWFLLGRPVAAVGGGAALQSWSGSMFEYLMPPLLLRSPYQGLLAKTNRLVVRRQMEYTSDSGIPWGISEAAYNARDVAYTYQYSPFGVPGLGIMRGLADNLVIAPYATALAAMIDPGAALTNFGRLDGVGALGRFGFYESVDYTPARLPEGAGHAVVRCHMAHHQAMSILAIHNVVQQGALRDYFHAEPLVRSGDLLLQEQATTDVPVTHHRRETGQARVLRALTAPEERVFTGPAAYEPAVHHMSNGSLSLTLTPAGGGHLRWQGVALTRWHPDPTSEEAGSHVFLRDEAEGDYWSATPLPILAGAHSVEVRMADDKVTFTRNHHRFTTRLTYHLSPEADAAVRHLTIHNRQRKERRLTLLTYAEPVLAPARDDDAHPAFAKLFVATEFLPERGAVIAHRRRRNPSEPEVWFGEMIRVEGQAAIGALSVETDRATFLGRGRTIREAGQLHRGGAASGRTGHVIDPVLSLQQRVRIPGDSEAQVTIWSFAASTREDLLALMDRHSAPTAVPRLAMLAWTQSQVELRHLGISTREAGVFQTLAGRITYPIAGLRPSPADLARDAAPQSALWPLGVSGDLPIVVLRIPDTSHVPVVQQLIRAFEYWRLRRFAVDVVLLNLEPTSYAQDLHLALESLAGSIRARTGSADSTGRIFVVRGDQTDPATLNALLASAAVVLDAGVGDLEDQLPRAAAPALGPSRTRPATPVPVHETPRPDLVAWNGYGGFAPDGREYVTVIDGDALPPAPWSNVVAGPQFGFLATAEGAGTTWYRNARDNVLTPWRNDTVTRTPSEAVYVRDDETGRIATPTALPIPTGRHLCRHGFGRTTYVHNTAYVHLELTQFVPDGETLKVGRLRVTNPTDRARRYTITTYAEAVLGQHRHGSAGRLISSRDAQTGALFVRNPWSLQYADQVVFADLAGAQESVTADRGEFLGRQGTLAAPAAVLSRHPLSGRTGPGLDPCLALRTGVHVPAGGTVEVCIVLGAAADADAARAAIARQRRERPEQQLATVEATWSRMLDQVEVRTPDPTFDLMVNGWLLYQTLAARVLGRTGFYQTSGAFGFRDQLQDGMAVVLVDPALAREHLLRAAGRQFPEGDVQHWWLPEGGAGIRTRITDDVVWLATAVTRYVAVTGDVGILDVEVPWLDGPALEPGQHENFFTPTVTTRTDPLYVHCTRALEHALRTGSHGLPLMGSGDWNDGMNRVGVHGRGESVWLGWFLLHTLDGFLPLARGRRDFAFVARCRQAAEEVRQALEREAWDGQWYRRGYFDDGTPLGSVTRPECQIDSIAQSWATLSGQGDPDRAAEALREVDRRLVMHEEGIARLFTPPFDTSEPDPGYVRSYPPGIRENGGQYTHGASWLIFAYAEQGWEDKAGELFDLINPVWHGSGPERIETYRVEPYVVAADVYSVQPHVGRGGWTWYTGSSAWLYRAAVEAILGLQRRGDRLLIRPCLPPSWTSAQADIRVGAAQYAVQFSAPPGAPGVRRRVATTTMDGVPVPDPQVLPLRDDGRRHTVIVTLARDDQPS